MKKKFLTHLSVLAFAGVLSACGGGGGGSSAGGGDAGGGTGGGGDAGGGPTADDIYGDSGLGREPEPGVPAPDAGVETAVLPGYVTAGSLLAIIEAARANAELTPFVMDTIAVYGMPTSGGCDSTGCDDSGAYNVGCAVSGSVDFVRRRDPGIDIVNNDCAQQHNVPTMQSSFQYINVTTDDGRTWARMLKGKLSTLPGFDIHGAGWNITRGNDGVLWIQNHETVGGQVNTLMRMMISENAPTQMFNLHPGGLNDTHTTIRVSDGVAGSYTVAVENLELYGYRNLGGGQYFTTNVLVDTPAPVTVTGTDGDLRMTSGALRVYDALGDIVYTFTVADDPSYLRVVQDNGDDGAVDAEGNVHQSLVMQRLVAR